MSESRVCVNCSKIIYTDKLGDVRNVGTSGLHCCFPSTSRPCAIAIRDEAQQARLALSGVQETK